MNHTCAATASRVQQSGQLLDEITCVGGQRGEYRFGSENTVLAFHTDDGDGGGFVAALRPGHHVSH
jgi:hypothetical protein